MRLKSDARVKPATRKLRLACVERSRACSLSVGSRRVRCSRSPSGQPRAVKTIWKQGRWTLDELDEYVPLTLTEGLVNPAPAREE